MRSARRLRRVMVGGTLILFGLQIPALALAHGGDEGLQVEPGTVAAGGTVTVAGTGLEPDSDRAILLVGEKLVVQFDTVRTDAEGMFVVEITVPAHLPAGTYEVQAVGDEVVSAELTITGGPATTPGTEPPSEEIVARTRAPIESAVLVIAVALLVAVGSLLAFRAESLGGGGRHPVA